MAAPCDAFERAIVRDADGATLTLEERRALDAHVSACDACRAELEQQRSVARTLHARAEAPVRSGFAFRVASRLDRENEGMLGLANWRAWTVGLAPVAAALILAAYLGVGSTTSGTSGSQTNAAIDTASPFDSWTAATAGSNPAAVFLQPSAGGDVLLETVLTGTPPASTSEGRDVR